MAVFVLVAMLAVNVFTILCFRLDKQRAVGGGRRIPEADLLGLAMVGGAPGALLARQLYRHKLGQPFSNHLHVIFGAQTGVLISLTFF